MAELIGTGQCVVRGCTSKKARFTLSSAGLAVCTDKGKGGCQAQCFARDEESDELFRACIIPAGHAEPSPAPAPAPTVPADPSTIVESDDAEPDDNPPPPPARTGLGWGLLR